MRRAPFLIAGAVVVAAGAVAYVAWPRGATPVSEQEALDRFRSQTTSVDDERPESTGTGLPAPGVYTYESTGHETVKLGVLPAEDRTYPETMSVVIVRDGDDCFTTTVNLLDQHTEDTTYCTDGAGGLQLRSHTKHQRIGPLSPTASMTCDPADLVAPGKDTTELACTLDLEGGPAKLSAQLAGTTETVDDTVTVAGDDVAARAVDVTYRITGDLTGTWQEKVWFAVDDWQPLRIERALDLKGLATFTERSTLELTDLAPRR